MTRLGLTMRVAIAIWVMGLAGPARAAPTGDPEAMIKQGVELRRRGEDDKAEVYFRRAYEIAPTPRSAAQLGLVELAVKRFSDAETYLSEALESDDVWIQNHRATLDSSRLEARKHLAHLQLDGVPADATVTVGGGTARKVPRDGALWVAPGLVSLRIEAANRPALTYSRSLADGDTDKISMAPALVVVPPVPAPVATVAPEAPPPAPAIEEASDSKKPLRIAGIATAGVGVAAVVTGLVLRGTATSKLNAIAAEASAMQPYDDGNGNWKTYDRAGVGMVVGGAVAIAGGAVLYLVGRSRHPDGNDAHVALQIGPGSLGFTGAF